MNKRDFVMSEHEVCLLEAGQIFAEESVLKPAVPSVYTVTVLSQRAELWMVNEFELNKRLRQVPETKVELTRLMQEKAKQVYKVCLTQSAWSLKDAETFKEFYLKCFYDANEKNDPIKTFSESDENKKVLYETAIFDKTCFK